MEIPDSITKLTAETVADPFAALTTTKQLSLDEIIGLIKQRSSFQNSKSMDEGIAHFKQNVFNEKNFLKNFFTVYNETVTKAINASAIDDNLKQELVKTYTSTILSSISNIEALHTLAIHLNKNENIIDVQRISYIILGYVIDTIKKLQ